MKHILLKVKKIEGHLPGIRQKQYPVRPYTNQQIRSRDSFLASRQRQRDDMLELQLPQKLINVMASSVFQWSRRNDYSHKAFFSLKTWSRYRGSVFTCLALLESISNLNNVVFCSAAGFASF